MRLVLSDTALPTGLPVREDWHYVDLSQPLWDSRSALLKKLSK